MPQDRCVGKWNQVKIKAGAQAEPANEAGLPANFTKTVTFKRRLKSNCCLPIAPFQLKTVFVPWTEVTG